MMMRAVGRVAGVVGLVVVFLVGLLLIFRSLPASKEQGPAAPPTPLVSPTPVTATPVPVPTIQASGYVSREVVVARVGSGPGEIGIKAVPGEPMGPSAFVLDGAGNIFIADRVNGRVNEYIPEGAFVSGIPMPPETVRSPRDLAVDATGALYILDGLSDNVSKLTQDGKLVRQYSRPTNALNLQTIRIVNGTLLTLAPSASVIPLGTIEREFTAREKGENTSRGGLYSGGVFRSRMFQRNPDGRRGTQEITLAQGKSMTLTVVLPAEIPGVIGPTGPENPGGGMAGFENVDKLGNIYVTAEVTEDIRKTGKGYLLRYDQRGGLQGFIQLPSNLYAWPNSYSLFRIDDLGNVFVLEPYKDQVKVIKWELK